MENELIEYGIEINEIVEVKSFDHKIPIDKDDAIRLSSMLSATPILVTNRIINNQVKGLYSITANGENVLPNMLSQKNNGSYISNLKGNGKGFGKQADINPFDSSVVNAATLASSVFAVASVATSQYYLKNIDDKL